MFGRGGEEVQALQEAGIAFEVVPGVTAATGCASAAGIPLTHREMAHSCVFLPGHLADDQTRLDWAALARPGQTRVFYMEVARLASIAQALVEHGLAPDTPAAIVQDGTREGQVALATVLSALAANAPAYGPRPGLHVRPDAVACVALRNAKGEPLGWQRGPVLGLYSHGLFESPAVLRALFGAGVPTLDSVFDGLADFVDCHFAPGVLARLIETEGAKAD